jgi:hypothetical protein
MVDVDITSAEVVLRVRGLHRLWALKREVRIPRAQLKRVEAGVTPDARARLWRSLRMPGTSVPSLITAGSYRSLRQWAFWDVVGNGENAVTLSTEGHRYKQLVVDVADPKATVEAIDRAIRSSPAAALRSSSDGVDEDARGGPAIPWPGN